MTRRTRGREIALQVLYQTEQNPGLDSGEIRRFVERRLRGDRKLCEFAESLIAGVHANQPKIDSLISGVAENWRLDRMAAIDRNILRLGAYEMLFCPDVPVKVAINESLELAKRYSTAQSSRFVNGILDRLQAVDAAEQAAAAEAEAAAAIAAQAAAAGEEAVVAEAQMAVPGEEGPVATAEEPQASPAEPVTEQPEPAAVDDSKNSLEKEDSA